VPIVTALDKPKVGEYIAEGRRKGIDLSACDFKHIDRSNPTMLQASIQTILDVIKSSPKAKYTDTAVQRSAGAASSSAQHERPSAEGADAKRPRPNESTMLVLFSAPLAYTDAGRVLPIPALNQ